MKRALAILFGRMTPEQEEWHSRFARKLFWAIVFATVAIAAAVNGWSLWDLLSWVLVPASVILGGIQESLASLNPMSVFMVAVVVLLFMIYNKIK